MQTQPAAVTNNDIRDAGQMRLGAGMRAPAARPPAQHSGLPPLPAGFRMAAPASGCPYLATSAVADAGRVRLGAGMRRG